MKPHPLGIAKAAFAIAFVFHSVAPATEVIKSKTVGDLRIELHVLPAEPFFTAGEAAAKHVTQGMLIVGGAAPVAPDSQPRPNHHLVVHVYKGKSGKAITNAAVTLDYQAIDKAGKPEGAVSVVPVVIMEAVGKGPQSTHYGNNVLMAPGPYSVTATVNGKKAAFSIIVSEGGSDDMSGMHMGK